jgi:nicotinate-nucleotide adenylyltransferase
VTPGAQGVPPGGLALFGGAFNPPHRTHRRIAEQALRQLPVHELRVLPVGDHPHKRDGDVASAADRLAMCALAFAGLPRCVVDDRELRRRGPSFTVDTLQQLADEAEHRPLFFVIGADNLPLLPTWREHHRILRLCTVATFPRAGCPLDERALHGLDLDDDERRRLLAHVLATPPDDVNASALRARLRAGERALPELLPEVEAYVRAHALYGT